MSTFNSRANSSVTSRVINDVNIKGGGGNVKQLLLGQTVLIKIINGRHRECHNKIT